jgi:hypothetical protein
MSTRLTRLMTEAHEAAKFHEHEMTRFKKMSQNNYESKCKNCYMHIWINLNPMPNDCEITGMAVACNCTMNRPATRGD